MDLSLSELPVWALVALAVLVVAQITLDVIALVDLYRRPVDQVLLDNKWIWLAIILLANIVGAIIYLGVARKPAVLTDDAAPVKPKTVGSDDIADLLYGPRDDTDPS
jgi:Phospholipase_D-nuclease N-terminal